MFSIESTVESDERSKAGIAELTAPGDLDADRGDSRAGQPGVEPLQEPRRPSFCAFTERATTTPSAAARLPPICSRTSSEASESHNGVFAAGDELGGQRAAEVGEPVVARGTARARVAAQRRVERLVVDRHLERRGSAPGTARRRRGAPGSTFVRTEGSIDADREEHDLLVAQPVGHQRRVRRLDEVLIRLLLVLELGDVLARPYRAGP